MNCTVVIPNRNRDLSIVQKTLQSLVPQLSDTITVVIVDYGSNLVYQKELDSLVKGMMGIKLILCPTQHQLWHKTRAINIVLKECLTTYFMVLDMDCIVHPTFLKKAMDLASEGTLVNFPYGFLSQLESKKETLFELFSVDFVGKLTGTIIAKTKDLQALKGYDEFYHNWGAEDADIITRFENNRGIVKFYNDEVLLLHQWHPKVYRSKKSTFPYHDHLEQINHSYYTMIKKTQGVLANENNTWGQSCVNAEYARLKTIDKHIKLENTIHDLKAVLAILHTKTSNSVVEIIVIKKNKNNAVNFLRKALRKKIERLISMESANEYILEFIIENCRNAPYTYSYDRVKNVIHLVILK